MIKKLEELKIKLLCDIKKFIKEEHPLNELRDKAVSLCLLYFPESESDSIFLNTIAKLSCVMQNLYFYEQDLDDLIINQFNP